jgi:hypothetical protein
MDRQQRSPAIAGAGLSLVRGDCRLTYASRPEVLSLHPLRSRSLGRSTERRFAEDSREAGRAKPDLGLRRGGPSTGRNPYTPPLLTKLSSAIALQRASRNHQSPPFIMSRAHSDSL